MLAIWSHALIVLDILSMKAFVWALGQLFAWAADPDGGILDSHLFFYERYSDLAEYHRAQGRTAKAAKLAELAEGYYQAAPDDDEPEAAAMAMPVPRPPVKTNAVSTHRLGALVTTLTLLVWTPAAAQNPPPQPQQSNAPTVHVAKAGQYPGLPRFGTVSNQLYRGGQPDNRGFAELKELGIDLVVNLRNEPDEISRERALVEAQGLRYASIPWRGKENPKLQQVAEFLDLLRANAGKKVFVHCERGSERTGVMVATYRMSAERWTPEQALTEMTAFGFRRFGFGHLRQFVRQFPTLLTSDPLLSKSILEK